MTKMSPGKSTSSCSATQADRDDMGSCPCGPSNKSPEAISITLASGSKPLPSCAAAGGCGGTLCSSYFCNRMPAGKPPEFLDPKDPRNNLPRPTTTVPITTVTITVTAASPTETCDEKCKLDRGNPCTCARDQCHADSPSCCADHSCPLCECNGDVCTPTSPACCITGTCAWSWTGGDGGALKNESVLHPHFATTTAPSAMYDI
ncbi:hypothetical protein F4776DRAFT_631569 [Hypoxylon sp. NC0597]|nr:hypothetical protein F4776DRAFT_631569 [Hypoxylon sp. NC0597]